MFVICFLLDIDCCIVFMYLWCVTGSKCFFVVAAPTVLRGCHQLVELGQTNHHPQKRHLPRQAGRVQAFGYSSRKTRLNFDNDIEK